MAKLSINQCPDHGFWSVSIDSDNGGGTRITPGKCCGRWQVVKSWKLGYDDWHELINEAECALEQDPALPNHPFGKE
jgi:hypothetical protein